MWIALSMSSSTMTIQGLAALKQKIAIVSNKKASEQYRDSFADQLSDLFGRSRWALAGLALETWELDIRGRINELLQTHHGNIFKDQAVCVTSICHCWMLGYSKECALPTVVICCSEPAILRRSMRVVIGHELLKPRGFDIKGIAPYHLQLYAGVVLVQASNGVNNSDTSSRHYFSESVTDSMDPGSPQRISTPRTQPQTQSSSTSEAQRIWPRQAQPFLNPYTQPISTREAQRISNPETQLIDGTVGRNVCGVQLVAEHSHRKATLGGALLIDGEYYGLTSAHVLQDTGIATEPSGPISQDAQMYDSDWAERSSSQSDDENIVQSCPATEHSVEAKAKAKASFRHEMGHPDQEMPNFSHQGKNAPTFTRD